jgi:tetratricopeptide (TPR) repeat protein
VERAKRAYEARDYALAAAQFEEADTQCQQPHVTLLPLAQAQLLAQRPADSVRSLDSLLAIQPKNVDALKVRGDALYILGREKEAEQALKLAIQLDPGHAAAQYALGRIHYQQNRFPEAIELFERLLQRDAGNYRAHDNLALCYAAVHQDANALRHFLTALDLVHKSHPEYDTVYANAANFFLDRGEFGKAFQLGAEAAKRNPSAARNFFVTGKALVRLGKDELSVRWFNQATALDPAYKEPHYWLANVYRKLGRAEDAKRELELFRELSKAPAAKR